MTIRILLASAATALALSGCARADAAPRPAELAPGVDACEQCHMSVDDPGLAAQLVEPGGRAHKFDEPGCLVSWMRAHPDVRGAAFVRDYGGGGWIPATDAAYVRGLRKTAMGFGIVAYGNASAAAARASAGGGAVTDWGTLLREGAPDAHAH